MKVFFHSDSDGRLSAAIALKALVPLDKEANKSKNKYPVVELVEMDYNKKVDIDAIKENETVLILDFSFKPEVMNRVLLRTTNIVWIDHHATAAAYEYQDRTGAIFIPAGARNFENKYLAACELTWVYYFPGTIMPEAVKLVGDYDKWSFKMGDRTNQFRFGLETRDQRPDSALWVELLGDDSERILADRRIAEIVNDGRVAIVFRDNYCQQMLGAYGYETNIGGYPAYALNVFKFGSQTFGPLIQKYPICIAYVYDGRNYTVSLYTENSDIDVGEICKNFGGGGHKGAAGFVCKALPFQLESKV